MVGTKGVEPSSSLPREPNGDESVRLGHKGVKHRTLDSLEQIPAEFQALSRFGGKATVSETDACRSGSATKNSVSSLAQRCASAFLASSRSAAPTSFPSAVVTTKLVSFVR